MVDDELHGETCNVCHIILLVVQNSICGKLHHLERKVAIQVNITPQGRMSLPAELRKRLGLAEGGAVFLEETKDGVVLRTAAQAVAHAQAIAKRFASGGKDVSVSGFLAHRKTDSGE